MDIDIDRWRAELLTQKKTFVYGRLKEGENWLQECFKKAFNRNKFPLVFSTNPNLYKPTR